MTSPNSWFARRKSALSASPPETQLQADPSQQQGYTHGEVAAALYRGLLGRDPDAAGLAHLTADLAQGALLEDALRVIIASGEFQLRSLNALLPGRTRPVLPELLPAYYATEIADHGQPTLVFKAGGKADFELLERLMSEHGYYDQPGAWGSKIDLDKQIIAAIVLGLGARSCLEIGCFTGAVLSLLETRGVAVTGVDSSHLAFVLAYPNIRPDLRFGDLLSLDLTGPFDCILAMDVLEHLNPFNLPDYIRKISTLVSHDGFVVVNSPMFGTDDVFGTVFPPYLPEWHEIGQTGFWGHLHCDAEGWPLHGHLVWASPQWWERSFQEQGLVRDRAIEAAIQEVLGPFLQAAPARGCLFVLRRAESGAAPDSMARNVRAALAAVEDLPAAAAS